MWTEGVEEGVCLEKGCLLQGCSAAGGCESDLLIPPHNLPRLSSVMSSLLLYYSNILLLYDSTTLLHLAAVKLSDVLPDPDDANDVALRCTARFGSGGAGCRGTAGSIPTLLRGTSSLAPSSATRPYPTQPLPYKAHALPNHTLPLPSPSISCALRRVAALRRISTLAPSLV